MKTNKAYKLILADDHILLRDTLASLINSFQEFSITAVAGNGKELIQCIEQSNKVDIVLMDLNMPKMDGYEAAQWLAENRPGIKIIVLTMYDSEIALIRLLRFGIHGFLKKDIHPNELHTALLTVAEGEYYYSHDTTLKIASLFRKKANKELELEKSVLSNTEIEFLKLASQDITYREIAMAMALTPKQTDRFREALFVKLEVKSRIGLVIYAVKNGIINY